MKNLSLNKENNTTNKSLLTDNSSHALIQQLATIFSDIADKITISDDLSPITIIDEAHAKLFNIVKEYKLRSHEFVEMTDLLSVVANHVDKMFTTKDTKHVLGVSTGFTALDALNCGLHGGDLVIVAGDHSMGKSTFLTNIAQNVAIDTGEPVAFFSSEITAIQLVTRIISSKSLISLNRLQTGHLQDDDWEKLTRALGELCDKSMFIDDSIGLSAADICIRALRLHREHGGLNLILIDSLETLSGIFGSRNELRDAAIVEAMQSLKNLAMELDLPVIVTSRLNHSFENRSNKRPVPYDLSGSGAIEKIADKIMFIYRDEFYNPSSLSEGLAEITVAKNNNGPIGTIRLKFNSQNALFVNY